MKYIRFILVLMVAIGVIGVVHYSGTHDGKLSGMKTIGLGVMPAFANPADTSGPNSYGNGIINGCAGTVAMAAGQATALAPCLAGYAHVGCVNASLGTPAIGDGNNIACVPTATVTAGATVAMIQVLAATANATPTIVWWGIY